VNACQGTRGNEKYSEHYNQQKHMYGVHSSSRRTNIVRHTGASGLNSNTGALALKTNGLALAESDDAFTGASSDIFVVGARLNEVSMRV
jgi:hypothetical protein